MELRHEYLYENVLLIDLFICIKTNKTNKVIINLYLNFKKKNLFLLLNGWP